MELLSIEDYWERLERHDWFYAWREGDDGYAELVEETKLLFNLSRVSRLHHQIYTTYYRLMYADILVYENDHVGNLEIPHINKPEAA